MDISTKMIIIIIENLTQQINQIILMRQNLDELKDRLNEYLEQKEEKE